MPICKARHRHTTGIAVVMSALHLSSANSQAPQQEQPADFERAAAEQHFTNSSHNLHDRDTFPDGARGEATSGGYEPGFPTPPEFKTRADLKAHLLYCNSDAIVLANLLESEPPVLTSNKATIYTVSHFSVLQVLKADGAMVPGQTIVTYRLGGELVDEGETLRVDTPDAPPYKPGKSYLLFLTRDRAAAVQQYCAKGAGTGDEGTTLVSAGRVHSSLPRWTGIEAGTTYANVVATFMQASKLKCN